MNTFNRKPSRDPKELVERYLQAVRFWAPKSQRDLLAELAEDLRSQIDDKETELGRTLTEEEVSAILKRCGAPVVVGSRLGPKRQLIGPELYPVYAFVLKMVLLWILVPLFLFILGPIEFANGRNLGEAIATTFGQLWSAMFIAGGIITFIFAVIERTGTLHSGGASFCDLKWDPLKLPPLQKEPRKTSLTHTAAELFFNIFGLVWLLLVPYHPFLILGPAASFLKATPLIHACYLPILLLNLLISVRCVVTLARPQWTWVPLSAQLMHSVLTLVLLNFVLTAVGKMPSSDWHPFVVVIDGVQNYSHYLGVANIVNVSILLSLLAVWLGLSIATVFQLWEFLKYIRKRVGHSQTAASLNAH